MVRAALITVSVWLVVAAARADEPVVLPPCSAEPSAPLDGELLRTLLELEILESSTMVRIEVGDGVCTAGPVEVRIVDRSGEEVRCVLPFPEESERRLAARALSLAIAERMRTRAASGGTGEPAGAPGGTSRPTERVEDSGGLALAAPVRSPGDARAEELRRAPAEPSIPATLGLAAAGRIIGSISVQRLSWLLGLRGDVGASLTRWIGLRGELLALWSHGDSNGFSAEASLFAVATTLVVTPLREARWDLSIHLRAELGALLFFGPFSIVQTGPWLEFGGALAITGEVSDGVALTADLGASWNALGGQFYSPLGDLLIDLSVLTLDLGVGVRFAI